jgi:hypothetical protein
MKENYIKELQKCGKMFFIAATGGGTAASIINGYLRVAFSYRSFDIRIFHVIPPRLLLDNFLHDRTQFLLDHPIEVHGLDQRDAADLTVLLAGNQSQLFVRLEVSFFSQVFGQNDLPLRIHCYDRIDSAGVIFTFAHI